MAIARIFSKGVEVFDSAPQQVKDQLASSDPNTVAQGQAYLKGKGVKQQEIDAIVAEQRYGAALDEYHRVVSEPYPSIPMLQEAKETEALAYQQAEAYRNVSQPIDPYAPEIMEPSYIDVTPPMTGSEGAYEEIGYHLPDALLTKKAISAAEYAQHFAESPVMHVRRERTTDSLRVFEIQSDAQNVLKSTEIKWLDNALDVMGDMGGYSAEDLEMAARLLAKDAQFEVPPEKLARAKEVLADAKAMVKDNEGEFKLSPYNIAWQKDLINRQFLDAANTDKKYVDFLIIPGGRYMQRSDAVQKTYEGSLRAMIEKQAKRIGATVEEVSTKGMDFAVEDLFKEDYIYSAEEIMSRWLDSLPDNHQIVKEMMSIPTKDQTTMLGDFLSTGREFFDLPKEVQDKLQLLIGPRSDTYLRVKLPTVAGGTGLAAFSIPAFAIEEQVQEALDEGHSPAQIKAYLAEQGEDPSIAFKVYYGPKAQEALDEGYSPEEVLRHMQSLGVIPTAPYANAEETLAKFIGVAEELPDGVAATWQQKEPTIKVDMTPEEQVAALENMHFKYSTMGKQLLGWLGDYDAKRQAEAELYSLNQTIVSALQERGVQVRVANPDAPPSQQQLMYVDEQGQEVELEAGILDSLLESKFEIGGAITGGLAGARGYAAGPVIGTITTLFGGAAGAAFGRGADVISNAMQLKEDIEAQFVVDRMVDAGVADATFGIVLGAAFQGLKGSYYGTKAVAKQVGRAWDAFAKGNKDGAYESLKQISNLNEQQLTDILREWEATTTSKIPRDPKQARIQAYIETQPGGQTLVKAALPQTGTAGSKLAAQISNRANELTQSVKSITNENIGTILTDDLAKYTQTTKTAYRGVKDLGINALRDTNYRFNYDRLAIEPILEHAEAQITNPALLKRFELYAEKIRKLGMKEASEEVGEDASRRALESANPLRSFENLLELRQTVNEFRYNTKFRSIVDREAADNVVRNIDAEIARTAQTKMPNGKLWLDQWRKVNREYSKMKALEANTLYRALTTKGVDPKRVINALSSRITAVDGTFMEVLGKLPVKTRVNAEGAVLDHLVTRHSVGFEGGKNAINFPALDKELSHIAFTSPETRNLKRIVSELAKVYKNDAQLSVATGQIPLPKFQSYLTADPVVRLKFEAASAAFNGVKSRMPTEQARQRALVGRVAKALDTPVNVKNTKQLLKELPADPELETALRSLAIQYAKTGQRETYPKVSVYRVYKPGSQYKTEKGKLGTGRYFFTDEESAKAYAKSHGAKVSTEEVLPKRIAAPEDLKLVVGRDVQKTDYQDLKVIEALKDKGFLGIAVDDKVMLFK